MGLITLIRKQDGRLIASKTEVADRFGARLKGLIGRTSFSEGEALLFPRCSSVPMWMMSIAIDVVFLKKKSDGWEVVGLHPGLRPWRLFPVGNLRADDALELPAGSIGRIGLKSGEVVCIAS